VKYRLEATCVTADADAEMVVPHGIDLTCKATTLRATAQSLAVSVLDLVATRAGEAPGSAIARSVELARHVEQLGYKRYWVAEHHAIQGLACSATPVLIGHIAAATETIRVGRPAGHISWFEQSDRVFSAADSFLTGSWPEGTSGSSKVERPTGKEAAGTVPNWHDKEAGQKAGDAEKELIQLEKDFAEATLKGDHEFYDRILADDWINIHEDGSIGTKHGDASHKTVYDTATFDDIKVRVYGQSAVATGCYSVG
jgi:hypothetical protein